MQAKLSYFLFASLYTFWPANRQSNAWYFQIKKALDSNNVFSILSKFEKQKNIIAVQSVPVSL